MKRLNLLLLLWVFCAAALQAQDFRITKFQENMLDLTAARAAVKDNNGDLCALIKFSVRDDKFVYEPNMGVVKQERKVGETWLYVPKQTKRITIRHPQLGVLRDYVIPVTIEQKVVYEAELQITNQEYLRSLLQRAKTDTVRIMVPQEPTVLEVEAKRNVHLDLGVGFNSVGIMGPTAHIGLNVGNHVVEAGATIGISKSEGISIYRKDNAAYYGTYDYSAMRFFARYGYNFEATSELLITPLVGAAINNISGAEVRRSPNGDVFSKVNSVSATIGCRVSYCMGNVVLLFLMPEFSVGVKKDDSFIVLKDYDSKIKSWTDGIGLSAGVVFHF